MRPWSIPRETETQARAGAEKLLWYMTANKVPLHFCYPPGYVPTAVHAKILRGAAIDQHAANRANATVDKAVEAGIMFAGTPDQVFRQIKKFYDHVGGFGHLLIMGQAGFLEHDETVLRDQDASRARSIRGSRRRFPTRRFPVCIRNAWSLRGDLHVNGKTANSVCSLPNGTRACPGSKPYCASRANPTCVGGGLGRPVASRAAGRARSMTLTHETGLLTAPVPVYFETFAPAAATGRPTVVMVHGGAHSGACYQRTADGRRGWAYLFAARGYPTVVPDWPGTGRSGYIPLDQLNGATVVEGLGALIRSLGAPVVLLTHSMSGCYGWRLLELHGD